MFMIKLYKLCTWCSCIKTEYAMLFVCFVLFCIIIHLQSLQCSISDAMEVLDTMSFVVPMILGVFANPVGDLTGTMLTSLIS